MGYEITRHLSCPLLRQSVQDITGHALHHGIAAAESVRPIGSTGRKDGASPCISPHDGGTGTVLFPVFIPLRIVRMPSRWCCGDPQLPARGWCSRGFRRATVRPPGCYRSAETERERARDRQRDREKAETERESAPETDRDTEKSSSPSQRERAVRRDGKAAIRVSARSASRWR